MVAHPGGIGTWSRTPVVGSDFHENRTTHRCRRPTVGCAVLVEAGTGDAWATPYSDLVLDLAHCRCADLWDFGNRVGGQLFEGDLHRLL